jgi:hypothetical protein
MLGGEPKRRRKGSGQTALSKESDMAKGQKSNKEIRKPKKEKAKGNASNPSTKGMVGDIKAR